MRTGGYAEDLIPCLGSFPPESIASLELAMCVEGSINRLQALDGVKGKRLAISGLGPAGLIAVQMARAYGAREVIGIDPLRDRCDLAQQLGAHSSVPPGDSSLPSDRFAKNSFDAALDTTGLTDSIEMLMKGTNGAVAIFGVLRQEVRFGPSQWWGGSALLGYGTHERRQAEQALRLIESGQLKLSPLVTHQLSFSRYAEGIDLLRRKQAVKVLFLPWVDT
jgi:threonine dehydrogenase-like Zn-dependent dehydrogenase